jgi:hypothetical protein
MLRARDLLAIVAQALGSDAGGANQDGPQPPDEEPARSGSRQTRSVWLDPIARPP